MLCYNKNSHNTDNAKFIGTLTAVKDGLTIFDRLWTMANLLLSKGLHL